MPHGFFTIEQWRNRRWVTVCHVDGRRTLTDAIQDLKRRDKPGFFRVVQTQRMIAAEKIGGKLHLRKWHALRPETLARSARAFDREGGKRPQS
jgi:hypothetical protein